jgi:hypothetical protein
MFHLHGRTVHLVRTCLPVSRPAKCHSGWLIDIRGKYANQSLSCINSTGKKLMTNNDSKSKGDPSGFNVRRMNTTFVHRPPHINKILMSLVPVDNTWWSRAVMAYTLPDDWRLQSLCIQHPALLSNAGDGRLSAAESDKTVAMHLRSGRTALMPASSARTACSSSCTGSDCQQDNVYSGEVLAVTGTANWKSL